jgi:hypothetical protein
MNILATVVFASAVIASWAALAQPSAPVQRALATGAPAPIAQSGSFTCQNGARCQVTCGNEKYEARIARLTVLGTVSTVVVYDGAGKAMASVLLTGGQTCTFSGMEFSIG